MGWATRYVRRTCRGRGGRGREGVGKRGSGRLPRVDDGLRHRPGSMGPGLVARRVAEALSRAGWVVQSGVLGAGCAAEALSRPAALSVGLVPPGAPRGRGGLTRRPCWERGRGSGRGADRASAWAHAGPGGSAPSGHGGVSGEMGRGHSSRS
ncbi:hypothetical protein Sgou_53810 [Streptomyces gougerotii]|uniref:Uncharacterized protein n=1 Tax=Streptomyces gougerotii TaxID=53448 RepID=A0A8H9LJA1_9ACTN|nr:hypothetical protein Sgou_53810 [Streptomyces gougerotii]GGU62238.1 hypothetical protein GCM10010227_14480 [Streptomyces gougerotii]